MSVRLVERFATPLSGSNVDKTTGIVRGVLLCGAESKNGRSYPAALWPKSIGLYSNVPIHADHGKERRIGDRIGWVSNARVVDGKPRGDANFLTSHPLVPPILEMAERNPSLCGFSHVCIANTKRVGGKEMVESIERVDALDFVCDPATMAGMYESVQQGGRTVANKATRVIEDLAAGASGNLRSRLRRVVVEQLDGQNHRDAVTRAFTTAGQSVWLAFIEGEITEDDMLAKLKKLARGHRDSGGSGDGDGTPALESRGGVRFDAAAGRLVPDGRTFAEYVTDRPSRAEAAAFVESVTGRKPKPSATWDGQCIRFTD